jgi:small-conductance mechanosensitive channel
MSTAAIAAFLKPLILPIFMFLVVAPIVWVLYKIIPNSRLKVFLFKVRGEADSVETPKEKTLSRVLLYGIIVGFYVFIFWLASRSL